MKNTKTQGFVLIDVDVVALNNARKKTHKATTTNAIATKSIRKNGKELCICIRPGMALLVA